MLGDVMGELVRASIIIGVCTLIFIYVRRFVLACIRRGNDSFARLHQRFYEQKRRREAAARERARQQGERKRQKEQEEAAARKRQKEQEETAARERARQQQEQQRRQSSPQDKLSKLQALEILGLKTG